MGEARPQARQRLQRRRLEGEEKLPGEELIEALRDPAYRLRAAEEQIPEVEPSVVAGYLEILVVDPGR